MNEITVYTSNNCPSCHMVKRYLDGKNLNFQEVNIEEQPERASEAFSLSGVMRTPVMLITNGQTQTVIQGWNPAQMIPALKAIAQ